MSCDHHVHVPAGHGQTFEVRAGQYLTVIDSNGQQAADFVAVVLGDTAQHLSPVHTRRHLNSLFFQVGDHLYSNTDEPLLTVLSDSCGVHDANVPACDSTRFSIDFGVDDHRNCLDNLHEGLSAYGVLAVNVPEPFNLFQNGPVTADGRMQVTDPTSKPGDRVVFKVHKDLVCAVSSCPQDIIPGNGLLVTPIDIRISDDAPELV